MSLTLLDVCERFGSDDRCREMLVRLRWPEGVRCLRCAESDIIRLSLKLWHCRKCRFQFTVTAGTIFHDSHLPLLKWFAAAYLICESRKGMSANQIKRMLGISYKTAWYLCHRIRFAMREVNPEPMSQTVQHTAGEYVRGMVHSNTVENSFSLLKRGIMGTWHKISAKHLSRYLDEMCFRFNRRDDKNLFEETLRYMVTASPLTFQNLTNV